MFPSSHAASRLDSPGNSLCWSAIFVYLCTGILSAYFSNLMNAAALMRVLIVRAASATTAKVFLSKTHPANRASMRKDLYGRMQRIRRKGHQ